MKNRTSRKPGAHAAASRKPRRVRKPIAHATRKTRAANLAAPPGQGRQTDVADRPDILASNAPAHPCELTLAEDCQAKSGSKGGPAGNTNLPNAEDSTAYAASAGTAPREVGAASRGTSAITPGSGGAGVDVGAESENKGHAHLALVSLLDSGTPLERLAGVDAGPVRSCTLTDLQGEREATPVSGHGQGATPSALAPARGSIQTPPPTANGPFTLTSDADPRRCQRTAYDRRELSTTNVSFDEARGIKLEDYDFAYAPCFGRVGLRLATGEWIEVGRRPPGPLPKGRKKWTAGTGLGRDTLKILQALQFDVPCTLTPGEIADATKIGMYREDHGNLQARIAALRGFFGDDAEVQGFIITDPLSLAYGWNPDRTWIWLELVAPRDVTHGRLPMAQS